MRKLKFHEEKLLKKVDKDRNLDYSLKIEVKSDDKPCLQSLYGIKRVFYTNNNGEFVCEKVNSDKLKNRLSAAFRSQNPGNYWRIKK